MGFLTAKGGSLLVSTILGGLATDPIDKLLTSLVAFVLLRKVPARFFAKSITQAPADT